MSVTNNSQGGENVIWSRASLEGEREVDQEEVVGFVD